MKGRRKKEEGEWKRIIAMGDRERERMCGAAKRKAVRSSKGEGEKRRESCRRGESLQRKR